MSNLNPDDPNQNQGGGQTGSIPAMGGGDQPAPVSEPSQTPSQPQPDTTAAQPTSENCHCGRPTVVGNCSGCNLPTASCACAPAAG